MELDIRSQLVSEARPIEESYLAEILKEVEKDSGGPKKWAEAVALKLSQKESRYKFLVLVTEIESENDDGRLNIKSSVAAVWDSERDGSITVSIPGEPLRVLTVFWVYAS